jgi:hypothetical protein
MKRLLFAALVAALTAFVGAADAATFLPIGRGDYYGRSLVMTGEIIPGDAERLTAAIERQTDRGVRVERVFLNSPGGNVQAGAHLAKLIYDYRNIDTVVGRTDECASICVLVFAAGANKVVYPTSKLGVHSASTVSADGSRLETTTSIATTATLARLMAAIRVPNSVIVKMLATETSGIEWLDYRDLNGWVTFLE